MCSRRRKPSGADLHAAAVRALLGVAVASAGGLNLRDGCNGSCPLAVVVRVESRRVFLLQVDQRGPVRVGPARSSAAAAVVAATGRGDFQAALPVGGGSILQIPLEEI